MNDFIKKLKAWWRSVKTVPPADNPPPVDQPPVDQPFVDQPPVVDAPAFPASWNVTEIKRWDAKWKVMGVHVVPRGLIVSIYDRVNREQSEIHERSNGQWKRVWSGNEETIGAEVFEPATVLNGITYFAAERGRTFLKYDHRSGGVSRGASIPNGYKWNVFTHAWKGTVAVGADGPDTKASVFDALTGKKMFQSALDGLIAGMTVDGDGVLWLAISDGQQGVANSTGWSNRDVKPSSICYVPGLGIVVGSQVDGVLKRWTGTGWLKVADLDCSKINRMTLDASRGLLLVSGAKPDTFATLDPKSLTMGRVTRFNDEAKDKTGEQFDTDINPGPDGSLILARANGSGCYVYEAKAGASEPTQPPAQPSAEAIDWSAVQWMNGNLAGFTPRAALKAAIGGGKIRFELSKAIGGNDLVAVSICRRDGQLYGGSFDGVGSDGSKTLFVKSLTNMGARDNSKGGPYWAGSNAANRKRFRPVAGETMWVAIVDKSTASRTTVAEIIWKE